MSEVIKCTKNDWTGSTPSIILRSKSNNNNNDNNNSKFHVIVVYLEMVFNKLLLHQHYRIAKPSQASCFNYRWLDFNAHENFVIKIFVITVQLRKIRIFFATKIWSHTVYSTTVLYDNSLFANKTSQCHCTTYIVQPMYF